MIKIHVFEKTNSILNTFISELRNIDVQKDRMRFRRNLERAGEIMAYEISKVLDYEDTEVVTPLGVKTVSVLKSQPVLATILRAGLPFHNGLLNVFDKADNAFIAAYRKYDKNEDFEIRVEYYSAPDINDKVLIICDPMLATGESFVKTLRGLLGDDVKPREIHVVVAIASAEGLEYIQRHLSKLPITLWVASVDDELTAHAYIVPGLGDAGDLAFGEKK